MQWDIHFNYDTVGVFSTYKHKLSYIDKKKKIKARTNF